MIEKVSPPGGATIPGLFSLRGRVALVTGASSGIGLAIARGLAEAGAHVLINGRDPSTLADVVGGLVAAGLAASAVPFDVVDEDATRRALELDRLDILVNNVGQRLRAPLEKITPVEFAGLLNVDLVAAFAISKRAAEIMRRRHYGRLIMISSIVAQRARANDVAYIAAKGGVEAMVRALACEFASDGITCNAIAPGGVVTRPNAALASDSTRQQHVESRVPLRRLADAWEIAGSALFLASEASSYVTGHVLAVDGGLSSTA